MTRDDRTGQVRGQRRGNRKWRDYFSTEEREENLEKGSGGNQRRVNGQNGRVEKWIMVD